MKRQAYARQWPRPVWSSRARQKSPHSALENNWNSYEVQFSFANYGDRPVIGIEAEVWIEMLRRSALHIRSEEDLLPHGKLTLEVAIELSLLLRLGAW